MRFGVQEGAWGEVFRRVNKEGAVDRCGWRMSDGQVGCEWVSVTSGTGLPGLSQT